MKQAQRSQPVLLVATVLALFLVVVGGLFLGKRWLGQGLIVDMDQLASGSEPAALLAPGQTVGQTFVARHAGLAGIEFYLVPNSTAPATLTLHLRVDPSATEDLATATMQVPPRTEPGFYRFTFPPLSDSHGQYYYAFLGAVSAEGTAGTTGEAQGDSPGVEQRLHMPLASGAAYLDGAAYQNHEPLDAQSAFRLVYAPGDAVADLLKAMLAWVGLLAVAGLLFLVPGGALLAWTLPRRGTHHGKLAWPAVLGLAVGTSIALYPLLILWTDVVGLHLGVLYAWIPAVAGLAALAWRYRAWRPQRLWAELHRWARSKAIWPDLTLLILLALALGARLLVVRSLDVPMWGDSFQHTMVAQLLVDNGGLFDSWDPYAELTSLTYHFGFQSNAAAFHWLTGIPVPQATLWVGQVLNLLAVLAVYPLALRVTGSRWGATWAVLLAGLLSPMPMSYTNWGRYTQLAGQVILPAAIWLTWELVEGSEGWRRLLALSALVAGGLAVTHYRVLIFYGVFVLALFLVSPGRGGRRASLLRLVGAGVGAGLLFLPWLLNNLGGTNLQMLGLFATQTRAQSQAVTQDYNAIGRLETYLPPLLWLAMFLGLGLGLWQRRRGVLLVAVWWFLLLLATNPTWLSLPGAGAISNFALLIFAYLPAGLFSGMLLAHLARLAGGAEQRTAASRRWLPVMALLAMVGLGVWGTRERLGDLDPGQHALVTRPDVRAAAWVRANASPEDRFLINSFPVYSDSSVVGSDGGWWLPLLAGRLTTVPPLNYSSEQGPDPGYSLRVNDLSRQVRERGPDDEEVLALLEKEGITHVYIGQRQGRVNYTGPEVLDPVELLESFHYRLVYHQDRVWIFERNP